MAEEHIFASSQLYPQSKEAAKALFEDWLIFVRLMIEPQDVYVNEQKMAFDKKQLLERFDELAEFAVWFRVEEEESHSSFQLEKQLLYEKTVLERSKFELWEPVFLDYHENRIAKHGYFGYIRSYEEYRFHNTLEPREREKFEDPQQVASYPKIKTYQEELLVDGHIFPGYDLFYEEFCLTSCWRMYYGREYQGIIPWQVLENVQQVELIRKIGHVLLIELHKEPFNWQVASNLHFQRLFREQIGIDHLIWTNGVGVLEPPFTEYIRLGSVVQVVHYQNKQFQPVDKDHAETFTVRSINLQTGEYLERRVKGRLNAQAYFPWIDDEDHSMLTYRVLHPELTLDHGKEAIVYYIREYLESIHSDHRYDDYAKVLRFYIPKDQLSLIPFDAIFDQLFGMNISEMRDTESLYTLKLDKKQQSLVVQFFEEVGQNKKVEV